MTGLYRDTGLEIYEKVHYSCKEHVREVDKILSWLRPVNTKVLDIGCSGGLHAVEFARRGYSVTGFDIEPSAVDLARRRSERAGLKIRFLVCDIEREDISGLGTFGFVYSIGNVMSHLRRSAMPGIFERVRRCLDSGGMFLFDVLSRHEPFQEEIIENDYDIIWKRRLDKMTGAISMDGEFTDFGLLEHFDLWGYSIEEVMQLLASAGFTDAAYSDDLTFEPSQSKNPNCLRFRARTKEILL